jgi:hypothetical protein
VPDGYFALKLRLPAKARLGMYQKWSSGEHKKTAKMFESNELKEAERFFEWALLYERKGLKIAADALRDEGRKALQKFLGQCSAQAKGL